MQRFRQSRLFTQFGAVVVTLVILAAVAVAESAVHAPIARATPTCSVRSLKGEYLGNFSGMSSSGPQALQGRVTFHGDGTGSGSFTLMTQTSGPTSFTNTATYSLKSDCTGTETSVRSTGTTAHFNIVVVDDATQVDFLRTDPGFVVTGTVHKVTSTCSVRSLKGEYLGNLSGVSSSTGPLALQVRATYHGDGTATASATLMTQTSGPTSSTDTATYTVKSDCTGTVTIVRSTGQTAHFNIVLVDNATEIDHLQTDPGFVVTGTLQKK